MNWAVLAFAMGLSALVAIALGLLTATACRAARSARRARRRRAWPEAGAASQRVGRIIVAAQMAMTVVLLVGAALLGRSLLRVLSVDPGFRTDGIVAMDLALPDSEDPTAKARLSSVLRRALRAAARDSRRRGGRRGQRACRWTAACPTACSLMIAPKDAPKTMADISGAASSRRTSWAPRTTAPCRRRISARSGFRSFADGCSTIAMRRTRRTSR